MKKFLISISMMAFLALVSCGGEAAKKGNAENNSKNADAGEVNVYTHRHYDTDQKLFAQFEEETGIKVKVVNAGADELIQRMKLEGEDSPADVLITVDAGRLHRAKEMGLLQAVESENLNSHIPANLRDSENYWFGLTSRARIIAYNPNRVKAEDIADYEDLADEKFRGKLLVRSSSNIYNQSLAASVLAHEGAESLESWIEGMVLNFARNPKGSDRDQVKAVASGDGDLAIVNSYYLGKMLHSSNEQEVKAGKAVKIMFPNQSNRGTHINVSGAGVAKGSPNPENAVKFIEFLVSKEAQEEFAGANFEYPVREDVEISQTLKNFGEFKADTINLSALGENNNRAVKIMDKAGWK